MVTCRYPNKRRYATRDEARDGAETIRRFKGGTYVTLYPYRCPGIGPTHWHLSTSRQGTKPCPCCGQRQPAWFDKRSQEWVVYAHGECLTQAVSR